jgi:hypothetical protein
MSKVERYEHHGAVVAVQSELKGKHREHCLCWSCAEFRPDDPHANCPIARAVFAVCVEHNLVTPVYECPKYRAAPHG